MITNKSTILIAALGALTLSSPQAWAESASMTEGVAAFKDGDYKQAEIKLGCAAPSEFSNPIFHYYMANTYIHVNKKELAIQEYRIAFALAPEKEVGKLSKQALISLGAETVKKSVTAAADAPKLPALPKDLMMESAKNSLQDQAENAKQSGRSSAEKDAIEAARLHSESIAKAKKELEENIRAGKASKESLKQLEQLQKFYEGQRSSLEKGNSHAQEIQKSADNLRTLLEDKKPMGTKLNPVGTNLYVRNYSDSPIRAPMLTPPAPSSSQTLPISQTAPKAK